MMSASGSAEMSRQDRFVGLLRNASIIPVITVERVDDAVPLAEALVAGGLRARFCPTGGIDETNTSEWLAQPNVVAVGGSWLAPATEVRNGDWPAITKRVQPTLAQVSRLEKGLNQVPR